MALVEKSKGIFGRDVRPVQNRAQRSMHQKDKRSMNCYFINSQIIAAASTGELDSLLSTIGAFLPQMNLVNLSTAIHRLAKISSNDQQADLRQHPMFNDLLVAISKKLQNQASGEATLTQCVSNVTWSVASLRLANRQLIELLATHATIQMSSFKSHELSTVLWGFAKLDTADFAGSAATSIFQAAAFVIPSQVHHCECRCLSMIVWAFATVKQCNSRVFSAVATQMISRVDQANSQEIANTAWAFGTVHLRNERLFAKLADRAVQCIRTFKPQELSNLIWGFACNRCYNKDLFKRAVEVATAMCHREELQTQHLANILWGFARVQPRGIITRSAFLALLPPCTRQLSTFKPQEISSTTQAVAKVFGLGDEYEGLSKASPTPQMMELPWQVVSFFACTVPWAAKRVHEFADQGLVNIASAYGSLHVCDDSVLFKALEKEVLTRVGRGMDPSQCLQLLKGLVSAPRAHCGAAVQQLFKQFSCILEALTHSEVVMLSKICVCSLGLCQSRDMKKDELRISCLILAGEQENLFLEELKQIHFGEKKEIRLAQQTHIRLGSPEDEIYFAERSEGSYSERKKVDVEDAAQSKMPGPLAASPSHSISTEASEPMSLTPGKPVDQLAESGAELLGVEMPLSGAERLESDDMSLSSDSDDTLQAKHLTIGIKKDTQEATLKPISSWYFSVKNSFFHVECGSSTDDGSDGDVEDLEGSVYNDPSWDSRSLQRSNSAPSLSGTFW